MIARTSDPWLSATLLAVSIAALGRAMQVGDGILKEGTIVWLAIGFIACIGALLLPGLRTGTSYGRGELVAALLVVLVCQIGQLFTRTPFNEISETSAWIATYRRGILAASMFAGAALLARGWVRHLAFSLLLGVHVLLGASVLLASPQPHIDVFMFQRDAADALLQGINPYSITFPDILGSRWYGEGVSVNRRLQFGYPYMPLTLLMALPGHVLGGDYRYGLLAAMTLSAALMAYARPSTISFAAAAILLLLPRGMYILERGWSEPFVVLMLCATMFCAVRRLRAVPWVLGLFLASKQYVPLAIGAALLLLRPKQRSGVFMGSPWAKVALAGAVITMPLVLWDVVVFWHSAMALQFRQPFREDSLNFVAWWMHGNRNLPPAALVLPFIALILATGAVLWCCPRTPAGFAAGTAVVLFAFFAFSKQAFGNYYYVVIAAMCCAIASVTAAEN